jgi:hypothetical protein
MPTTILHSCRKVIKRAFILTLPLTILPLICGITYGLYYVQWKNGIMDSSIDAHLHDLRDFSNDWGVTGFTFRDFQDTNNKLHLVRVNSNDWLKKLGFVLPREYGDWKYSQNTPLDKIASLDTLMFDTQGWRERNPPPKEQWVYVANSDWMLWKPWDPAFDFVVQAGYTPSRLNATKLHFLGCWGTAKFLCGIWGVRSPTLLHFLVEDEPPKEEITNSGLHYSTDLQHLRPVTVRVIELPLQGAYTGLASNVFPGQKEQMLSIMSGDRLYEQFEPWDESRQEFARYDEYMKELSRRRGTFFYYNTKFEDWIVDHVTDPLYLTTTVGHISTGAFMLTVAGGNLIWRLLHWAKQTVLDYLGSPRRGDWILADRSNKALDLWNSWMGGGQGWSDAFVKQLGKSNLEKNWPRGEITTGLLPGTTPIIESFTSITGVKPILATTAMKIL